MSFYLVSLLHLGLWLVAGPKDVRTVYCDSRAIAIRLQQFLTLHLKVKHQVFICLTFPGPPSRGLKMH